ncbi:MAG: hypothetical protein IJG38_01910 [Thermoguttaceae bacterium]|nr:hypothetical protein [Thermoguttaceae bacterium]
MTTMTAQGIVKTLVNRQNSGIWVENEFRPVKYHVAQNRFYIALHSEIKALTRNELIELITQEEKRLERLSKIAEESNETVIAR